MRIACSTACLRHSAIDVALEEIKRAGFGAIDLTLIPGYCDQFDAARQPAGERDDFVALIRSNRLLVPTVTAAPGNFNSPVENSEFVVQSALAHLKLAAQLACEGLNVTCGVPAADPARFQAEAWVQAAGIKMIAREAMQLGLKVNIWAPHRKGLCQTIYQTQFLLEAVDQSNVFVLLDGAQLQSGGMRTVDLIRAVSGRVGHVRLPDWKANDLYRWCAEVQGAGFDGYCTFEANLGNDIAEVRRQLRQAATLIIGQVCAHVGTR